MWANYVFAAVYWWIIFGIKPVMLQHDISSAYVMLMCYLLMSCKMGLKLTKPAVPSNKSNNVSCLSVFIKDLTTAEVKQCFGVRMSYKSEWQLLVTTITFKWVENFLFDIITLLTPVKMMLKMKRKIKKDEKDNFIHPKCHLWLKECHLFPITLIISIINILDICQRAFKVSKH